MNMFRKLERRLTGIIPEFIYNGLRVIFTSKKNSADLRKPRLSLVRVIY